MTSTRPGPAALAFIVLVGSLVHAGPTAAREPGPPPTAQAPRFQPLADAKGTGAPFSLTLSGGISLGAYEAGLNWALLEWLKTKQTGADPSAPLLGVSGASAGAINALISAMRWCERDTTTSIDDNLFSTTWRQVGLDDPYGLLPERTSNYVDVASHDPDWDPDFLISRKNAFSVVLGRVAAALDAHRYRPGCRVRLSLMVTKVQPRRITVDHLSTRSQRLVVPLVLVVDRSGAAHFELNLELLNDDRQRNLLGEVLLLSPLSATPDARVSTTDVIRAVLASSAHPSSFGPVLLKHCTPKPECPTNRELPGEAAKCAALASLLPPDGDRDGDGDPVMCAEPFIDGGAFDNVPLGIAVAQAESAVFPSGAAQSSLPVRYIYLDPSVRRAAAEQKCEPPASARPAAAPRGQPEAPPRDPITELVRFVGGMYSSASDYELHNVLRFNQWNLTSLDIEQKVRKIVAEACAAPGQPPPPCRDVEGLLKPLLDSKATLAKQEEAGDAANWLVTLRQFVQVVHDLLAKVVPADPPGGALQASNERLLRQIDRLSAQPSDGRVLQIPTRFPAITGALLAHFAAFFDRPFRDYDYYAGIYDGIAAVADWNCEACTTWAERKAQIQLWLSKLGVIPAGGAVAKLTGEFLATEETLTPPHQVQHPACGGDHPPRPNKAELRKHSETLEKIRAALEDPSRCGFASGICLQDVSFKGLLTNLKVAEYQAASPLAARAVSYPDDWWTEPASRAVDRLKYVNGDETRDPGVQTAVGIAGKLGALVTEHWYNLGHDHWLFRPLSDNTDWYWRVLSPSVGIATTIERWAQFGFLNYAAGWRNFVLAGQGSFRLAVSEDGNRPRFSSFDLAAGPTALIESWWFSSLNARVGRSVYAPYGTVPRPVSYEVGFGLFLNHLQLSGGIDCDTRTPQWDHKFLRLTVSDLAGLLQALM
jgi:predicted acylesterase/phospholipase RssA